MLFLPVTFSYPAGCLYLKGNQNNHSLIMHAVIGATYHSHTWGREGGGSWCPVVPPCCSCTTATPPGTAVVPSGQPAKPNTHGCSTHTPPHAQPHAYTVSSASLMHTEITEYWLCFFLSIHLSTHCQHSQTAWPKQSSTHLYTHRGHWSITRRWRGTVLWTTSILFCPCYTRMFLISINRGSTVFDVLYLQHLTVSLPCGAILGRQLNVYSRRLYAILDHATLDFIMLPIKAFVMFTTTGKVSPIFQKCVCISSHLTTWCSAVTVNCHHI